MHVLVGLRPITACICSLYKFFCYQKQFFSFFIKGTVQRGFRPPFFSSFEPAWATEQWVKIFLILVKFSLSYSNFYESPRGIILGRIKLPRVSYCAESISPGCHTAQSQSPRGMILRRVNLPGVWYCAESISPGYHTALSQSPWGIIPWRVNAKSSQSGPPNTTHALLV